MLWENATNKTKAVIKPFHIGVWAQMVSVALLAFDSSLRYIRHIWYTWVNTCDPLVRPHVYLQYIWAAWTKGRALSPPRQEGTVSVDICPTWARNKSVKVRDKWVNRRLALYSEHHWFNAAQVKSCKSLIMESTVHFSSGRFGQLIWKCISLHRKLQYMYL